MHRLWYFSILFASIVLQQIFLVPLGSYLLAEPLLPLIVLIILATATGSVLAEGMGFFAGFLWAFAKIDSVLPLGIYPLLLSTIAFVLGRLVYNRKAPAKSALLVCVILAVLFWGLGNIALKMIFVGNYLPSGMEFIQVLLSTIYSAMACFVVYPLLYKLLIWSEWNGSV